MAGRIFINYRRGDEPGFAGRLFDSLEMAFDNALFMDVDNIPPGRDFVKVLEDEVNRCDVLLAVIGKSWLTSADDTGRRRLEDPNDFVRIEIESALKLEKRVIPILVNNADMPQAHELPESLRPLTRRQAVRLTHDRFKADAQGLARVLSNALEEASRVRGALGEAMRPADARGFNTKRGHDEFLPGRTHNANPKVGAIAHVPSFQPAGNLAWRQALTVKSALLGFVAGVIAYATAHELISLWLFNAGYSARIPWSTEPSIISGSPQIIVDAASAGLWGMIFALISYVTPRPSVAVLRGALFGLVGPALIGGLVVVPIMHGAPPFGGVDIHSIWPILLVGAGFGAATAWLYGLFRSIHAS